MRYLSGDASTEPVSVKIYNTARAAPTPALNALATLLLLAALLGVVVGFLVYRWLTRGDDTADRGIAGFAGEADLELWTCAADAPLAKADCMFKQDGPAPVPADGLAAALAPFGQSRMLPREAYVDPGGVRVGAAAHLLRLDVRRPRRRPAARRAAQRAVGSGANGVLLVRGDDGAVRAFANTCRHRGHELLPCGATDQAPQHRLPVPRVGVQARRHAAQRAGLHATSRASTPAASSGWPNCAWSNWHGWLFVDPSGQDAEFADHVAGTRGRHRAVPPRGPDDRRAALLRAGHQLEGDRRELPGVLPLLDDPPRAVPDQPADQRREPRPDRARGWAAGCR